MALIWIRPHRIRIRFGPGSTISNGGSEDPVLDKLFPYVDPDPDLRQIKMDPQRRREGLVYRNATKDGTKKYSSKHSSTDP